MTEREKALSGHWHNPAADAELRRLIDEAQDLCYQYNHLHPAKTDERDSLLRRLLGCVGRDCTVLPPFMVDYGCNISLGDHVFINKGCVMLDGAPIVFGNHIFVGPNCSFNTPIHPFNIEQRNQSLERNEAIYIADNVWIGAQVCILPGVSIGAGSIIGAGSVVTRNIPSGVVAVGNPCRVLRKAEDRP